MLKQHEYRFRIDALKPDTLPMARLAEYMTDLATMLGEQNSVHFVRLEEGSTVLVHAVDSEAKDLVQERVDELVRGKAPDDAMKAFRRANKRLKDDDSIGTLTEDGEAEVLRFPGREMPEPVVFGPFNQEGTLDGKVIMVGGKQDLVPVHLQQGATIYNCHATRNTASELGHHLFDYELRVRGEGRWKREADGAWTLDRFKIHDFKVLEDEPLSTVVAKLREIPGSGWRNVDDPWSELIGMREYDDESH